MLKLLLFYLGGPRGCCTAPPRPLPTRSWGWSVSALLLLQHEGTEQYVQPMNSEYIWKFNGTELQVVKGGFLKEKDSVCYVTENSKKYHVFCCRFRVDRLFIFVRCGIETISLLSHPSLSLPIIYCTISLYLTPLLSSWRPSLCHQITESLFRTHPFSYWPHFFASTNWTSILHYPHSFQLPNFFCQQLLNLAT